MRVDVFHDNIDGNDCPDVSLFDAQLRYSRNRQLICLLPLVDRHHTVVASLEAKLACMLNTPRHNPLLYYDRMGLYTSFTGRRQGRCNWLRTRSPDVNLDARLPLCAIPKRVKSTCAINLFLMSIPLTNVDTFGLHLDRDEHAGGNAVGRKPSRHHICFSVLPIGHRVGW